MNFSLVVTAGVTVSSSWFCGRTDNRVANMRPEVSPDSFVDAGGDRVYGVLRGACLLYTSDAADD